MINKQLLFGLLLISLTGMINTSPNHAQAHKNPAIPKKHLLTSIVQCDAEAEELSNYYKMHASASPVPNNVEPDKCVHTVLERVHTNSNFDNNLPKRHRRSQTGLQSIKKDFLALVEHSEEYSSQYFKMYPCASSSNIRFEDHNPVNTLRQGHHNTPQSTNNSFKNYSMQLRGSRSEADLTYMQPSNTNCLITIQHQSAFISSQGSRNLFGTDKNNQLPIISDSKKSKTISTPSLRSKNRSSTPLPAIFHN